MINILIIDDEKTQVDFIEFMLCKLDIIKNSRVFKVYSPKDFIDTIMSVEVDIAFIDIKLQDSLNGIDVAGKLKSINGNAIIVFVTGYKEYGYESYSVHAFDYYLKPIREDSFKKLLISIKQEYNRRRYLDKKSNYFLVKEGDVISKVPYDDIFYFERMQRKVLIHSRYKIFEISTSLKKILSDSKVDDFFLGVIRVIL